MPLCLEWLMGVPIWGSAMVQKFLLEVAQRCEARYFSPFSLAYISRCDKLTRLYQNDASGTLRKQTLSIPGDYSSCCGLIVVSVAC